LPAGQISPNKRGSQKSIKATEICHFDRSETAIRPA
jgi:hypothetical protein